MCDETKDLESRYHEVIEEMEQLERDGKDRIKLDNGETRMSPEYSELTDELNGILDVLDPTPEEEE